MAAPSPAPTSNPSDTGLNPAAVSSVLQAKAVRHVNRPKCTQCGNLARSRCPYQSCKRCCSKARNSCHIHVRKANAIILEKPSNSITISFGQQSAGLSPAMSSFHAASLRQLSNSFAQLNNVQNPRPRKPPMTKEAVDINEWKFIKLKEHMNRTLEKQNQAYNRYLRNISLLDEAFSMKLMQGSSSSQDSENAAARKKRKQRIVDELLKKLEECQLRRLERVKTRSDQRGCTLHEHETRLRDNESVVKNEADSKTGMHRFSHKLVRTVQITDQGIVSKVDAHFASLGKIARM
ncbi:hypothetical protein LINPERPRIM_LOCUS36204 [Linum perenne]